MGTPDIAKKRILPPWMTKRVNEPAGLTNLGAKRRKKAAFVRTETIYCMNEAELVDMALCILAEDCTGKEADFIAPEDEVPKAQPGPTEPQHSAASSSKANITTIGSNLPNKLESLGCSEKIKSDKEDDEDDDALKYVREIFFS
ncbi:cell cycle regulator of non-homologous end joining [Tiliqua scincoides]|uniref:cell cycle regulator of non-homologous end joining n=1 Tax=Tiliqua scincoides TaxID=71010 RepID=UPI00346269EA